MDVRISPPGLVELTPLERALAAGYRDPSEHLAEANATITELRDVLAPLLDEPERQIPWGDDERGSECVFCRSAAFDSGMVSHNDDCAWRRADALLGRVTG